MTNLRHYFTAMRSKIEPSEERVSLCKTLPREVRVWLKQHNFETESPHTRLSGSYARKTAVRINSQDINDVDVLLFLPDSNRDLAPSSVLISVRTILEDYPDTSVETTVQRRSVRLDFPDHDLHLDIVPVVASDGLEKPLYLPNRQQGEWIQSDPLGYGRSLTASNLENGNKVVPLIKTIKAWRDVHMKRRRPKSYVLEAMIYNAVEIGGFVLFEQAWSQIYANFFTYVWDRYSDLFENGDGEPRVKDPQLGHFVTKGWERSHFETFMRRIDESKNASQKAVSLSREGKDQSALDSWARAFGDLWPSDREAQETALAEARSIQPGTATVASTGLVVGNQGQGTVSRETRYYGKK